MSRIAVVLFNLGGPDSLESVRPFLFNLFYDPLIIRLPSFLRWPLAKFISLNREKEAKEIYSKIGGSSPILKQTLAQRDALDEKLKSKNSGDFRIFICMRHFFPKSSDIMRDILDYGPDEIILLPLYPQFSTTTTLSSILDFKEETRKFYEKLPTIKEICCYPREEYFIKSHVSLIMESIRKLRDSNFRILFSAHSLPEKIIKSGDPYQFQVEESVRNIVEKLCYKDLDYKITYQSRVGPVKWLEPYTDKEIEKARCENKSLIIVPIAFVSEHSETLVELDIEYKKLFEGSGLDYIRVPALCVEDSFIESLSRLVLRAAEGDFKERICPKGFSCFKK